MTQRPQEYNIRIVRIGGYSSRPVGKIVYHGSESFYPNRSGANPKRMPTRIFHGWGSASYIHRNTGTLALNRGVLQRLREENVQQIFLYDKDANVTYGTTLADFEQYGVANTPDQYGQNLRLPLRYWSIEPGQLSPRPRFIPEDIYDTVAQPRPIEAVPPSSDDDDTDRDTLLALDEQDRRSHPS